MKSMLSVSAVLLALTWYEPASAECLARPLKDAEGKSASIAIDVPAREIGEYQSKGFAPVTCDTNRINGSHKDLCALSEIKNQAIQNRLAEVLGMPAAKICASGKLAKGLAVTSSTVTKGAPNN